jgi:2-polyprenyl-6-methoxyphenol hydroxylase-like FAD-dependent oxidoreductase
MGQGANQAIEDGMALATLMRANGMRMDSGRPITIGQPGVQDYDVEAEARAMR